jgi:hypothetical protein
MRTFLTAALLTAATLTAAPKQLFDGKTTDGWKMAGPGQFVVEDGLMKTTGGMGLLYYEKEKFANAKIKVVFKVSKVSDNSGVVIRLPEPPPDAWYGVHNGFEVQIAGEGDEWHCTGSIYSLSKASGRAQKAPGEWNVMEIEIRGPVTRTIVNGTLITEYKEGQPVPDRKQWFEPVRGPRAESGYIGLQNHDDASRVYFKEISVTPLQ